MLHQGHPLAYLYKQPGDSLKTYFDKLSERLAQIDIMIDVLSDDPLTLSGPAFGVNALYQADITRRILPMITRWKEELLAEPMERIAIKKVLRDYERTFKQVDTQLRNSKFQMNFHPFNQQGVYDPEFLLKINTEELSSRYRDEISDNIEARKQMAFQLANRFMTEADALLTDDQVRVKSPYHFNGNVTDLVEIVTALLMTNEIESDETSGKGVIKERFYLDFLKFLNYDTAKRGYSRDKSGLLKRNFPVANLLLRTAKEFEFQKTGIKPTLKF